jgi:hypothetical protein
MQILAASRSGDRALGAWKTKTGREVVGEEAAATATTAAMTAGRLGCGLDGSMARWLVGSTVDVRTIPTATVGGVASSWLAGALAPRADLARIGPAGHHWSVAGP